MQSNELRSYKSITKLFLIALLCIHSLTQHAAWWRRCSNVDV